MTAAACQCGCTRPVLLWIGSPTFYRFACPLCTRSTARQPSKAAALEMWNDYATGRRAMA